MRQFYKKERKIKIILLSHALTIWNWQVCQFKHI